MKYTKSATAIAAGVAMSASPVVAGGMAEPMMEPEVVAEEAEAASLGGFVVPLLTLAVVAAVASSSSSGSETPIKLE